MSEVATSGLSVGRGYFEIHVPAGAIAGDALRQALHKPAPAYLLDLRVGKGSSLHTAGRPVEVIPYPRSTRALTDLVVHPVASGLDEPESVDVLLPRQPFDEIADRHGAERIRDLNLRPGAAANDPVMIHLRACLSQALSRETPNMALVNHIASAVSARIAERFGGLNAPAPHDSGGLAPRQLRLARDTFDSHLDGTIPLADVARRCGLSLSHFSRAFTRSTGLPPHRWLMRRRIEVAKEMLHDGSSTLVEIALSCGFSDQSHFSRAFVRQVGLTPGRWRIDRNVAPEACPPAAN